jgi:2-dehydro-3-deoxyphosphogluconate aldolase / (4S)-4-hydroxy-2-oxoglutarate aldolase
MTPAFNPSLAERVEKCGIVAVLVVDHAKDAVPLAKALLAGGVDVMELTLRTPAAIDALKAVKAEVPEMVAGVGTILTPEQVREVTAVGADFGVAPGLNPRVLAAAREVGLSFAPGVLTPSEIELAVEQGCRVLKFFPAEPSGGLSYLKSIVAPYAHLGLKFVPLGGLNAKNMATYLAEPTITALGGSWLAPRDLIVAGKWDEITRLAAEAVEIIKSTRK